jgi:hypothetical protein
MFLNESLIISYSTPNYKLTPHFIESLQNIGVSENNINIFFDNSICEPNEVIAHSEYWIQIKIKKLKNLISQLKINLNNKNYKYFISSDCDLWFIKDNLNEWNNLQNFVDISNKDIFFMSEDRSQNINGGFYIIKNNENIKIIIDYFENIFNQLIITEPRDIPYSDQQIINLHKYLINYDLIPIEYVVWGEFVYNKEKCLFHHPVCCINVENKIKLIEKIKKKINKKSYKLVIAKYNEDLEWINYLDKTKIIIYDKSTNPLPNSISRPNIGRDPETLFYYISQNYDNLPDVVVFAQGDPFAHIFQHLANKFNLQEKINEIIENENLTIDALFTNLVNEDPNDYYHSMKFKDYFNFIFNNNFNGLISFIPGCQIIVTKETIQDKPKKFYEYIHKMVYNSNIVNFHQAHIEENPFNIETMSAWCLERLIWYIFNSKNYILSEKILNIIS